MLTFARSRRGRDLGEDAGAVRDRRRAGRRARRRRSARPGRLRRAALRRAKLAARIVAVARSRSPPRRSARRAASAASAARIASRLSTQTSGQIAGSPAATRVMSRKPPAASWSRTASLSASARRLVHQRPGDEVRHVAHQRDQAVVVLGADARRTLAPRSRSIAVQRRVASRASSPASGVRTQVHPAKRSARAPAQAATAREPAMGWPPTKRGSVDRRPRSAP